MLKGLKKKKQEQNNTRQDLNQIAPPNEPQKR